MYLKPTRVNVKVPDPSRAGMSDYFLPLEGREVEESFYWHRRLREGDVVRGQPPIAIAAPAAPQATVAPSSVPSATPKTA